jgi:hypothetical protein
VQLCLAGSEIELTTIELRRTGSDSVGLSSNLVARETFAREYFRFARGEHDLSRLKICEPAEPVGLDGQRPLDSLLLRA